jgi:prepilin-type N-terminal cleavage/methylation domain-containing protein
MKTTNQPTGRRGFTLVELLVVIVIIAALAGLSAPMILRQQKAAARTEAVSNSKQMGLALLEFDQEFGSFPDTETREAVEDATGTQLNFGGGSANDYFRQLIATIVTSEDIFYCKTSYTREPDNDISPGNALEGGEVGFGYVMLSQTLAQNTSGNSGRPVLVAPLLNAQSTWEFDPDPFGGMAVVYRLDNSAKSPRIRETDNYVTVGQGRTIQATGPQTVWGTSVDPTLVAPLKRGQ